MAFMFTKSHWNTALFNKPSAVHVTFYKWSGDNTHDPSLHLSHVLLLA